MQTSLQGRTQSNRHTRSRSRSSSIRARDYGIKINEHGLEPIAGRPTDEQKQQHPWQEDTVDPT